MESGSVDVHNRDASTTSRAGRGNNEVQPEQRYSLYSEQNYQRGSRGNMKENQLPVRKSVPIGLGLQGSLFASSGSPNDFEYYCPKLSPRQHHFHTQQRYPGLNQEEQRKALPPISTRVSGQLSFFTPNPDSGFHSSTSSTYTPNPQFSFNTSSPMAPPTSASTPQSSRPTGPSLRDRLGKALAARKKASNQAEETEVRPDSHGRDSIALTHTTTHSRSHSGVSTPPTGYSDPSPIFSAHMKQKSSELEEESDFDSDPWSHDDQRYQRADGFNGEYMVRSNYMPNTPLDTITEEEARMVAHRSAIKAMNSSSPAGSRHPVHSSSFEVTVSTEKSHVDQDYPTSHEDSAISSLRFGSSSQVLPIQQNVGRVAVDDSFGTNYYSSDESSYEGDHDEPQPVVSNPRLFQSSIVSRSLTSYPASEYVNLTDPSFGSDNSRHFVAGSQNFQSEFASQDFTDRSILPSQQTWETMGQGVSDQQYPSSPTLPKEFVNRNGPGPSVAEMLSVIPGNSQKSSSSRPAMHTEQSFAGIESGPNVIASGTMEAAKASSTILGTGSIRTASDNSSIPSRMSSNNRSVGGSAANSAARLGMGPRTNSGSSRVLPVSPNSFGYRPDLSRNPSDRSPGSTGAVEDYFRNDLATQLRRLSRISASSEVDGMNSSGIAVVVNVGDNNKIRTSSFRGSIEMLTGFGDPGNSKHASMQSRLSGESQDGLLSGQPSPAIIEEEETKTESRLSPDGSGSKNSDSSQESQENLGKTERKTLKSLQLPADVLLHPADPRYEHIYRMREVDPTEERIMVPVYQFPTPGSFPNRNALTRPIARKVSQRVESGSIASLRSARSRTPEPRLGGFEDIPLTPLLGTGSKSESERTSIRQQLKNHSLGSTKSSLRLPITRSKSPSFHVDLQTPAPVADIHPAFRPSRTFIRPSSPHLVPNSSFYHLRDLEASRLTASPEVMEQATRLSKFIFLCCFLFPPCLLILAYGGFDGLVAEISQGKVAGVTDHYKKVSKWVGWGLAVTIVAGVSGAIIGAVLVSSTSLGA